MLYVFLMQTGTLKTYDMNLALETVENLKLAIQRDYFIPKDKQVLLISGGDVLQEEKPVSYYCAGTDTNPIFVFSMADIESDVPPYIQEGNKTSNAMMFAKEIEACSRLPPTLEALRLRANLARNMYKVAENSLVNSENMNYTQHLQQQGWAAVIANLEDMVSGITKRSKSFEHFFFKQLELRNHFIQLLGSFTEDLQKLSKIPLLESLLEGTNQSGPDMTLLKWIINDDTRNNLELMATKCVQILDEMTGSNLNTISTDINGVLKGVETSKMKEVGGLPERLFCMDKLLTNLRNEVMYQGKLAQNIADHEKQILTTKDADILPDLSVNHQDILKKMHACHTHIEDMEERFASSKMEVSQNLHRRLKWIMLAEKKLNDKDSFLIIQYERLRWFKSHINIIKQIHKSPQIYFSALVEIVRRKKFSESFTQWAGQIVKNSVELYKEEVKRRTEFNHSIQNHFLKDLFPGISDMPPCFATEEPRPFDQDLPKVRPEDIDNIKKIVPEFNTFINQVSIDSALGHDDLSLIFKEGPTKIPKLETSIESYCLDSSKAAKIKDEMSHFYDAQELAFGTHGKRKSITSPNLEQIEASVNNAPDTLSSLDFETADFYNDEIMPSITEATAEAAPETSPQHQHQLELEGLLEEKKESIKMLQEKVNDYENKFRGLTSKIREIEEIKEEIKNLQHNCSSKTLEEITALKVRLPGLISDVQGKFESETDLKFCQMQDNQDKLEKQRYDMSRDMEHLQMMNREKDEKLVKLARDYEIARLNDQKHLALLQAQMVDARQRSQSQYLDFESIQMEKDKPESIENIDRYSFNNPQEKALMQEFLLWKTLKMEKQNFDYTDLVESVQEHYRMELSSYKQQQETEMEESFYKLKRQKDQEVSTLHANLEDKSKELFLMKENLSHYQKQNLELSYSIRDQQMSTEGSLQVCSSASNILTKDPVLGEGKKLQQFMQQLEDQKVEITRLRQKISIKDGNTVSLLTCDPGDIVLVYFEEKHSSYLVYNERPELFFIHTDCYEEMGLRKVNEHEVPLNHWALAEVETKEYCQAKKSNNRFKLPIQTRFYRVRVKPHQLKKFRKTINTDKSTTKQELAAPFESRN